MSLVIPLELPPIWNQVWEGCLDPESKPQIEQQHFETAAIYLPALLPRASPPLSPRASFLEHHATPSQTRSAMVEVAVSSSISSCSFHASAPHHSLASRSGPVLRECAPNPSPTSSSSTFLSQPTEPRPSASALHSPVGRAPWSPPWSALPAPHRCHPQSIAWPSL